MCTYGCARGWASAAGAPVCVKQVPGALSMAGYHLVSKWLSPRLLLTLVPKPCCVGDGKRTPAGFAICYPAWNERPKQCHGNLSVALPGCASHGQPCAQRLRAGDVRKLLYTVCHDIRSNTSIMISVWEGGLARHIAPRRSPDCPHAHTWLILPVVICLPQRLSHACLSINFYMVKLWMAH